MLLAGGKRDHEKIHKVLAEAMHVRDREAFAREQLLFGHDCDRSLGGEFSFIQMGRLNS